jgi:hypothetical protein
MNITFQNSNYEFYEPSIDELNDINVSADEYKLFGTYTYFPL